MQPAGKWSKLGKTQLGQDFNEVQKKHCEHAVLDCVCLWLSSARSLFFLLKLAFSKLNFLLSFRWLLLPFLMSVLVFETLGRNVIDVFFLTLDHFNLETLKWKVSHVRERHLDSKENNILENVCLIIIYSCPPTLFLQHFSW